MHNGKGFLNINNYGFYMYFLMHACLPVFFLLLTISDFFPQYFFQELNSAYVCFNSFVKGLIPLLYQFLTFIVLKFYVFEFVSSVGCFYLLVLSLFLHFLLQMFYRFLHFPMGPLIQGYKYGHASLQWVNWLELAFSHSLTHA